MNWQSLIAPLIALIGIPLAALLTLWRERHLKARQNEREDQIRAEAQGRVDRIRREQQEREDRLARERQQDWVMQRWWERKADAYTGTLEALWRSLVYMRRIDLDWQQRVPLTDEERESFIEVLLKDRAELQRAIDIGSFVIAQDAVDAIEMYFVRQKELLRQSEIIPQADEEARAIEACIHAVRAAAMRDLGLRVGANPDPTPANG